MMYSDAKEGVELGGEEHQNSNMGTQKLVKECVLRVTVQENQPPPDYSFKADIIIAMIASVPKDVVLLNDREVMVEFEGEVPIDILNEQLSTLRKWMGVLDVRVKCCWPIHGQTRIAQARRVLREGPQNLGSPQSSSKTLISPEAQMNVLEQLVQVLREPQGETARKQTLAFPKLNTYSGTETPGKAEVTFEAWRYEVKSLCVSHEESVVKEAMIRSLKEPAATVLRGLPTNATVKEILRHMEQRCDPTVDVHVMLKEFNNMTQGSKESAAAYITRLEATLHRIHTKHPDEIGENRAQVMLERGYYQGLRDGLKESLRYLYDNPDKTCENLVEKVIQIDGEKNGRQNVLSKSGIIDNEPKLSDTAGSPDTPSPVQELIKVLTVALQTDRKKTPLGKGKLPNKQAGAWSAQLVPSSGNTQVKGRVDRASARCNKGSGIGHFA